MATTDNPMSVVVRWVLVFRRHCLLRHVVMVWPSQNVRTDEFFCPVDLLDSRKVQ